MWKKEKTVEKKKNEMKLMSSFKKPRLVRKTNSNAKKEAVVKTYSSKKRQ